MSSLVVAQAFAQTIFGRMLAVAESLGIEAPPKKAVTEVLERLWQAALDGHVCQGLNAQEKRLLQHPACQPLVGVEMPLMIENDHLYLGRFWHAENRVSEAVRSRACASSLFGRDEDLSAALHACRSILAPLDPVQQMAVKAGLQYRLAILHGGPGTGKTRTIASLIACHALTWRQPVWVAAPTARAGARLMESLQGALAGFELDEQARACLPAEALTIQRLLGRLPSGDEKSLDASARPDTAARPPGLCIVDEASMLSLELCDRLFAALGAGCSLILVGDPNQLHSVETGAVFAALCEADLPGLNAGRVHLSRNFRQADHPELGRLADAVLAGDPDAGLFSPSLPLLAPDIRSLVEQASRQYLAQIQRARQQCNGLKLQARARAFLNAARSYRLISARRSGYAGADQLSEAVLMQLRRHLGEQAAPWFEGRLITITRNDYSAGLFNGDTGVYVEGFASGGEQGDAAAAAGRGEATTRAQPALSTGYVAFERQGELLLLPPGALPEHQDAYCVSVHQSQGSEFDAVDFIAAPLHHALATRELLYTAVTRAKSVLRVFGRFDDLAWAASHPTRRQSRLREKLQAGTQAGTQAG